VILCGLFPVAVFELADVVAEATFVVEVAPTVRDVLVAEAPHISEVVVVRGPAGIIAHVVCGLVSVAAVSKDAALELEVIIASIAGDDTASAASKLAAIARSVVEVVVARTKHVSAVVEVGGATGPVAWAACALVAVVVVLRLSCVLVAFVSRPPCVLTLCELVVAGEPVLAVRVVVVVVARG
jgi:hypothetical protein